MPSDLSAECQFNKMNKSVPMVQSNILISDVGEPETTPNWIYRLSYSISGTGLSSDFHTVTDYSDCLLKCRHSCVAVEFRHPTDCTVKSRVEKDADKPLAYTPSSYVSTVLDLKPCKTKILFVSTLQTKYAKYAVYYMLTHFPLCRIYAPVNWVIIG